MALNLLTERGANWILARLSLLGVFSRLHFCLLRVSRRAFCAFFASDKYRVDLQVFIVPAVLIKLPSPNEA